MTHRTLPIIEEFSSVSLCPLKDCSAISRRQPSRANLNRIDSDHRKIPSTSGVEVRRIVFLKMHDDEYSINSRNYRQRCKS